MALREVRQIVRPSTRVGTAALVVALVLGASPHVQAEELIPHDAELPQLLTLEQALNILRAQGLNLLIAEAAVHSAEGGVPMAAAIPNPVGSVLAGNSFTYINTPNSLISCMSNGGVCTPWTNNASINDSAAIEDWLSGKRGLRIEVARSALAAAKMARDDAERTLVFQVKAAYAQVAQAVLVYNFAKDLVETQVTTLRKFRDRYTHGAVNEGDLQRIEVQKLEADQALAAATQALRQARLALAFLLGARGLVHDFDVDTSVLDFSVPDALKDATEVGLMRIALDRRPDLLNAGYQQRQAEAQLRLTKRQLLPDITLNVAYSWGGYGGSGTNAPIQGPEIFAGLSAPLPVFYNLQGEIQQAYANVETNTLQHAQAVAQVANDVGNGLAAFAAAKSLVERMEGPRRDDGGLLESANGAFEIVALQYEKGAASLTDYLDALRSYIAIQTEYFGDLANYWTAIYQLEAAIAKDLRS